MLTQTLSAWLTLSASLAVAQSTTSSGLQLEISVANGLLNESTNGRIEVLFAPQGTDPLDDTDVTSSPDYIYGENVQGLISGSVVTLAGGSNLTTRTGVYGWPLVGLQDLPSGNYSVQAFMNIYETVSRSDGSVVSVRFPCGDGAPPIGGYGSLQTTISDIEVPGNEQTVSLIFNDTVPAGDFNGTEIGYCSQGNYVDTEFLKYIKIRSDALSEFWGRDMYVGATVLLPFGYNRTDQFTRYPVLYHQNHWTADQGAFRYPVASFSSEWDAGMINATNTTEARETPKMILITFRHETPFYDDSYAVNTANIGPYGVALNDELIPHLDKTFNTIAEPYARVQEGGSTGGWESAASLVFRPDLFGVTFTSYPDSLDFHRHQDIPLYDSANAYVRDNGSVIISIRTFENDTQVNLASVAQENHWELSQGTSSRSFLQWDIWNTVFGVQGYNNYPLEPWNKVTGEIYPAAVEYWKSFDLSNYITSNWDGPKNLGEVLKNRIFIYVGTHDDYFLNEGVLEFQTRVNAKGGDGWTNVTVLEGQPHGGNYQRRTTWDFLELALQWVEDHAPDGKTPLSPDVTKASSRGNDWTEVIERGGRQAAVARQSPPALTSRWGAVVATAGRWDPGVVLEAQWIVNGRPTASFPAQQGQQIRFESHTRWQKGQVQLAVTGTKIGYEDETRYSNILWARL
ncbi:hypothetical protein LTR86_001551 [Recurvomyces mirabilis]|nr:hypothetical protein LTR86_001551 [Recurvomyces mirabilis]